MIPASRRDLMTSMTSNALGVGVPAERTYSTMDNVQIKDFKYPRALKSEDNVLLLQILFYYCPCS